MRLISFVVAVVATAIMPWSLNAGDAPKRSAELQVLDRMIGDWETVVTVKGTGEKSTSIQTRKWSRDGKFVISEELDVSAKRESHTSWSLTTRRPSSIARALSTRSSLYRSWGNGTKVHGR